MVKLCFPKHCTEKLPIFFFFRGKSPNTLFRVVQEEDGVQGEETSFGNWLVWGQGDHPWVS